ncbi:hypothetical protein TSUD_66430 [Trifolium subterraneum]|uniref:Reverse transcriptase domain-containing protein n=1 Tax=Trifolium subterraneum TaxID=3900 RepID=A0A2Z6MMW6_TRISU|nr:hypothetical protein TSUD_66430 [Trifolium subterraneum]
MFEERLDKAMTSASWLQLFPQVRLSNLLASHSDHSPILLQCKPIIRTHISYSFRFENSWLKEPDLEDVVVEGWGGRENLEVVDRVTRCANKLQRWGKRKRVRFKEEIDECVRRMNELRGNQDGEVSLQYQELSEKHATLLIQEEGYWKQRAKMHWLQEGDMNMRFFHMSATARSKKKKVTKLVADNGTEAHSQEELCEVAKSYFDNLFKPRDGDHDPVLNLIHPRVTDDDNFFLTAPITKVEIQQALFQMHPDKSPGPDEFNPAFYQRFWEHCSDDIFSAASTWLERGYFPTSLNETNICLIPKCDNLTSMKDLRPISLCNVLYKMISKVLANRLKCCLDKCVSQEQSAFVEGRSILDNVLIATEVIHALKRKTQGRRGELALKIDISKAYDKVDGVFFAESRIATGRSAISLFIYIGDGMVNCSHSPVCWWRIESGENIRVMQDPWLRGDVAERILETPLVNSVREDKVVWEEERNGCYSVKSGYKLAMRYIIGSDKYHVAGCLPTCYRLLERRVECNLNCPVCDEEIEDEIHIFFRSAVARDSWCAAGLSTVLYNDAYQQSNAMDRIFAVCSNESSAIVGRVTIRHAKLEDMLLMLGMIGTQFISYRVMVRAGLHKQIWTSVGLCFRNNKGQVMAGMTQWQQTVMTSVEGEAWALLLAMEEARHKGLDRVQFESDSKVLVEAIHMKRRGNSEFLSIVHDIISFMSSFLNFEVKFVRRQANSVAHTLARAASSWSSFHRFENIPLCIEHLVVNEMQ